MHFQRKTEKTTQSKHKNAASGRKMRFPCLLGRTTRAKGHDECCCKSVESNNYSATWKTGRSTELIYAWECDAFNYQQLLRVALFLFQCISLSLSLSVFLSHSLSPSLFLMLHKRHSFGYSRYRLPLVRCRQSMTLIFPCLSHIIPLCSPLSLLYPLWSPKSPSMLFRCFFPAPDVHVREAFHVPRRHHKLCH